MFVCQCPLFAKSITILCRVSKYLMACKGFFSGYAVFAYLFAFKPQQTTELMAHRGFNKVVIMGKYGLLQMDCLYIYQSFHWAYNSLSGP